MYRQYSTHNPQVYTPEYFDGSDRFLPFFPFLTGALVGGAAVGLTRPRPFFYPTYPPYQPYPIYPPTYGPRPYFY